MRAAPGARAEIAGRQDRGAVGNYAMWTLVEDMSPGRTFAPAFPPRFCSGTVTPSWSPLGHSGGSMEKYAPKSGLKRRPGNGEPLHRANRSSAMPHNVTPSSASRSAALRLLRLLQRHALEDMACGMSGISPITRGGVIWRTPPAWQGLMSVSSPASSRILIYPENMKAPWTPATASSIVRCALSLRHGMLRERPIPCAALRHGLLGLGPAYIDLLWEEPRCGPRSAGRNWKRSLTSRPISGRDMIYRRLGWRKWVPGGGNAKGGFFEIPPLNPPKTSSYGI